MTTDESATSSASLPRHRITGTLALLALLPSWLGLAGGWSWFLDLFAHFRWQYLIAGVVIAVWAAWRRKYWTFALVMLTCLLNGLLIGRLSWHPELDQAKLAGDFELRMVSLNVLTSNPDKQAVLDYLLASEADAVFLMEVDQHWLAALAPLLDEYPHLLQHPRDDNFGVAFFSREPWLEADVVQLGDAGFPSVQVRMLHQDRELVVIGTHTMPPMSRLMAQWRDNQLEAVAEHVRDINGPVLVVGDLNVTPWSAGMRRAMVGNLGHRSLAAPWQPTWKARSIFAVPIDHVLATTPLLITGRSVGPDVGSDHRPLQIVVGMEAPP